MSINAEIIVLGWFKGTLAHPAITMMAIEVPMGLNVFGFVIPSDFRSKCVPQPQQYPFGCRDGDARMRSRCFSSSLRRCRSTTMSPGAVLAVRFGGTLLFGSAERPEVSGTSQTRQVLPAKIFTRNRRRTEWRDSFPECPSTEWTVCLVVTDAAVAGAAIDSEGVAMSTPIADVIPGNFFVPHRPGCHATHLI